MGDSGVTHPTASGWQAEYGGAVVRRPEGGSESALGSDLRGVGPEAWDPTGGAVAGGPGGHSPRVCGMGGRVAWGKKSATGLALWGGGQSACSGCAGKAAAGGWGRSGHAFPRQVPAEPLPSRSVHSPQKEDSLDFLFFF